MSSLSDGVVWLRPLREDEVDRIVAMEADVDTAPFIIPYTATRHLRQLVQREFEYIAICDGSDQVRGFAMLALDPDAVSVELARIVIADKGRSLGRRALVLLEAWCRQHTGRTRMWLDVFDDNQRAEHLYQRVGYTRFGESQYQGRPLRLYEKVLSDAQV